MLVELISALFHAGSGYCFPVLFVDLVFLITIACIIRIVIVPFIKAYERAKLLDQLAGTEERRWLSGHTKKYGYDEKSLRNAVMRTARFPTMFNWWYAPALSTVLSYHSDITASLLSSGAPKNEQTYKAIRPWIGDGLLTSKGKKWRRNRRLITPGFHYTVLQLYTSNFSTCARTLIKKWETMVERPIDVTLPISLMTLDVMLQCAMSSKTNCQHVNNHSYLEAVHELAGCIIQRFTTAIYYFDWIFYRSESGKKFLKACDVVHKHTEKLISERQQILQRAQNQEDSETSVQQENDISHFTPTGKKALDFLDILLQTKDEDGKGLTDIEIRDEVDTFLFEGHDTTASGISWALYNLAKYPEYQAQCREEVISIVGDKENVEWNDLPKLSYLTMFLKESMRLFPPVPNIGRRLETPLTLRSKFHKLKEIVLPKHTCIGLFIFALHRNVHVWENSEVFDPERFTKKNQAKRSPHAYVPFSAGSRNCIGQNFAMNEMKVVLSQVLRKYRLYLDEETPKPQMQNLLVLRSANGIWIKLKPVERN